MLDLADITIQQYNTTRAAHSTLAAYCSAQWEARGADFLNISSLAIKAKIH